MMLHTDFPNLAGAVAMPGSEPGILAPYQEKPQAYPLQFVLRFDPKRDEGRVFPLLMAVGTTKQDATRSALEERLTSLNADVAGLYGKTRSTTGISLIREPRRRPPTPRSIVHCVGQRYRSIRREFYMARRLAW